MKTFTKIISSVALASALFFSTNVNAQSRNFGIGLNLGVPTANGGQFAIGGDVRYQFNVDEQLSIPLTAGYTNLNYKFGNVKTNEGYIPVKVGAKYYFASTGSGVYGLAELGAGFLTTAGGGTAFVYSPAIGYSWANGLDLAAKYEALSKNSVNNGYVGIRLAYGFKL